MQAKFQPPEDNQNPFRRGGAASSQRGGRQAHSSSTSGAAKRPLPAEASSLPPPVGVPFSSVQQRFKYPHTQAGTPQPQPNTLDINQFYKTPSSPSAHVPPLPHSQANDRRSNTRHPNDGTSASMRRISNHSVAASADVVPYFQRGKKAAAVPPQPFFDDAGYTTPYAGHSLNPALAPRKTKLRNGLLRILFLGAVLSLVLGMGTAWVLPTLKGLWAGKTASEEVITPFDLPIETNPQAWDAQTSLTVLDTLAPATLESPHLELNLLPQAVTWPASATPLTPLLMPPLATAYHDEGLQQVIDAALANAPATLRPHIMVMNGQTLRHAGHLMTQPVSSASVIKLPLLYLFGLHVNAGTLSPQDAVYYDERHRVSGSGSWQGEATGNFRSAYQMAEVMIQNSDNCATEMMVEYLGGSAKVNQQWRALGYKDTRVRNILPDLEGFNTISPYEMVATLLQIKEHPYFTEETRAMLMGILEGTRNRSIIPALLPPDTLIAHKTGDIGKSLGESALVYLPDGRYYYISMMVERAHNDPAAREFMRQLSKSVWDYYQAQSGVSYLALPSASIVPNTMSDSPFVEGVPTPEQTSFETVVPPPPESTEPTVAQQPTPTEASKPASSKKPVAKAPAQKKPSAGYYPEMEVF